MFFRINNMLFAALVLVSATIGFLIAAALYESKAGGHTVHDWQTLITGLAAIFAAWLTVDQMRRSDRRTDLRHEEILALNLRSDALALQRAYFMNDALVRSHSDELRRFLEESRTPGERDFRELVVANRGRILLVAEELNKTISEGSVAAAESLYDADVRSLYEAVQYDLRMVLAGLQSNAQDPKYTSVVPRAEVIGFGEHALDRLDRFWPELKSLSNRYSKYIR